ncbi:MAG: KH domain-containing protein [Limnothrix sp. RL_2_0]|nr:KH domain-containing protein [Limnothrix sp. RL_2_0]
MPNSDNSPDSSAQSTPDYVQIVRFLLEPLIDDPESLKIDCEQLSSSEKVWVRVAFEQEDKGKVFGRGGRNIQAIETVLNTSAVDAKQQVHLDVFGNVREESSSSRGRSGGSNFSRGGGRGRDSRRTRSSAAGRPHTKKPSPQLRSQSDG